MREREAERLSIIQWQQPWPLAFNGVTAEGLRVRQTATTKTRESQRLEREKVEQ